MLRSFLVCMTPAILRLGGVTRLRVELVLVDVGGGLHGREELGAGRRRRRRRLLALPLALLELTRPVLQQRQHCALITKPNVLYYCIHGGELVASIQSAVSNEGNWFAPTYFLCVFRTHVHTAHVYRIEFGSKIRTTNQYP